MNSNTETTQAEQSAEKFSISAKPPIVNTKIEHAPNASVDNNGTTFQVSDNASKSLSNMQMQYALRLHQYVIDQIKFADQKAGFTFAISAGILAAMYKTGLHTILCLPTHIMWSLFSTLTLASFLLLFIGCVASFMVVRPRLNPKKPEGLIFWESVAIYDSAQKYVNTVLGLQEQKLVYEILDHHYHLSRVCKSKYQWLAIAMWGGGIGVIISTLILAFFS